MGPKKSLGHGGVSVKKLVSLSLCFPAATVTVTVKAHKRNHFLLVKRMKEISGLGGDRYNTTVPQVNGVA